MTGRREGSAAAPMPHVTAVGPSWDPLLFLRSSSPQGPVSFHPVASLQCHEPEPAPARVGIRSSFLGLFRPQGSVSHHPIVAPHRCGPEAAPVPPLLGISGRKAQSALHLLTVAIHCRRPEPEPASPPKAALGQFVVAHPASTSIPRAGPQVSLSPKGAAGGSSITRALHLLLPASGAASLLKARQSAPRPKPQSESLCTRCPLSGRLGSQSACKWCLSPDRLLIQCSGVRNYADKLQIYAPTSRASTSGVHLAGWPTHTPEHHDG
ncbi:hypothetical protein NDU88_005784 [Pleurodeles waltl]|uniref:Uncharacterized protein n=1 Tax=Pleurodeles waltl TaxID=8319 RepID=A0AAV7LQI3_PLEWA|nr:hypothetical protein NDU88_005784 [Pleurodeles waltl]